MRKRTVHSGLLLVLAIAALVASVAIPAAAAPRAPMAEFLFNSSFEVDGWWLFGGDVAGEYSTRAAKDGARSAMVGVHRSQTDRCGTSTVYQGVQIPSEATSAVLRFWYYPWSEEISSAATARVSNASRLPGPRGKHYPAGSHLLWSERSPSQPSGISKTSEVSKEISQSSEGSNTSEVSSSCTESGDLQGVQVWSADFTQSWSLMEELGDAGSGGAWLTREFDLSPWRGQAIWIAFGAFNNGNGQRTWLYVDQAEVVVTRGAFARAFLPLTMAASLRYVAPTATPSSPPPTPIRTATPVEPSPVPLPTATPIPTGGSPEEDETLNLLNAERARHGLPPLRPVPEITTAARRHSRDMAENHFTGHTGSDGSDVGRRLHEAGYNWAARGEIIAWGFRDSAAAMDWWMNDPPHRVIILSTSYDEVGVGYVYDPGSDWDRYWTVDFGRRSTAGSPQGDSPTLYVCTSGDSGDFGGSDVVAYSLEPCAF